MLIAVKRRHLAKSFLVVGFCLIAVVAAYFGTIRQTDPFFYDIVATAKQSLAAGQIECPATRPAVRCADFNGHPLIIHHLAIISGLSVAAIQYLPVGLFVIPLVWFVLLRHVADTASLAALFTIPFLANPSYLIGHPSTSAYVWSRAIYFSLLLALALYINTDDRLNQRSVAIALLVLGIGMANMYQSGTGWVIFTMVFAAGIMFATNDKRAINILIIGILVAILLVLMPNTQRQLIQIFILSRYQTPAEGLMSFFTTMLELAGIRESAEVVHPSMEQTRVESVGQLIWNVARLIRYPLLFGAVAILGYPYLKRLRQQFQGRTRRTNYRTVLIVAILGTATIHTLIYISRGRLSLRYASITFPILILAMAAEVEWPRLPKAVGGVFAIVSVAALLGFIAASGLTPIGADTTTGSATTWMVEYNEDDTEALSDFHTLGAMQVHSATESTAIRPVYYNDGRYFWIVSGLGEPPDATFTVINTARYDRDIQSRGWQRFPALKAYHNSPNELPIASKQDATAVYDDGQVKLYRRT